MWLRRTKKKCPACRQIMMKEGKGYICPDCGTKILGDTQVRPSFMSNWGIGAWR